MLFPIESEASVHGALNRISTFLHSLDVPEIINAEIATICSELMFNILKYGEKGVLKITADQRSIVIDAKDDGKGMCDHFEAAFQEGFSSSGSLGLGLSSIVRMSDTFSVSTSAGGSHFLCTKRW